MQPHTADLSAAPYAHCQSASKYNIRPGYTYSGPVPFRLQHMQHVTHARVRRWRQTSRTAGTLHISSTVWPLRNEMAFRRLQYA